MKKVYNNNNNNDNGAILKRIFFFFLNIRYRTHVLFRRFFFTIVGHGHSLFES